ncbi:unnamed protein product [Rotaria sordida]|uniref:DNA-directed primase/polymerase protein n=1 Tax=Rotaria sordida TaxID=392033 RepID=A0A815UFW6_9BILA|nr:unnamed protein product [Rotaria sordida]CAF4061574.1 unnamed protein product [Rotaria sordida]
MEKSWKNRLQEYCQKHNLPLPNYRIRQQSGASHEMKFQVEVEVNGRWYIGQENCSSKKEAEHSAAQKACTDLISNNLEPDPIEQTHHREDDSIQHMPAEYADIERFISNMVESFSGRIRKIRPPLDARGKYRIEITGNYRYCDNIQRHHKKNQVYFLVDPINRVYYQRCHDRDCQGFQSAKHKIPTTQTSDIQHEANSSGKYPNHSN